MAPRFVPRERKHKKLARQKQHDASTAPPSDPNALEVLPMATKAEIKEAKKAAMRAQIEAEGTKVSGKKAKRLEKYLELKLRKDENVELIRKLAGKKEDTSLYRSSAMLGRGRENKREELARALREQRAGLDVDGNNEEILFEKRRIPDDDADESMEDEPVHAPKVVEKSKFKVTQAPKIEKVEKVETKAAVPVPIGSGLKKPIEVAVGSGLKRPLDAEDSGAPVIKKKQKRGGIKSKVIFKPAATTEPAWGGFSESEDSDEEMPTDSEDESEDDDEDNDESEPEDGESGEEELDEKESDDEDDSSEEESEDEDAGEAKKERSSAFKAWANQQRDEAMGFQASSNIEMATKTAKPKDFKPRAPESEPLPPELQIPATANLERKAYFTTVERPESIQDVRLKLPVVAEEQKIMEAIHNNSTVVIYGATGSGKTTQVPQFLYEAGYGSPESPTPGMIGVTQPRRVAAVSMAKRVGDELGDHGKRVAYQIRFEGTVSSDTAIKFMTDGVLLREVAQDIALRKYSAIIIDEAHERSVNTDILIGMLSRVVKLRDEMALEDPSIKPLKLVIMSATLRITDFTMNKTLFATPPPVLEAQGRQYPVTNHFARKTHHDYVEDAFLKISKGHRKLPPGGILVFLTGQNEIMQLGKRLKEAFKGGSGMSSGPQVRVSGQDATIEAEDIDFGEALDSEQITGLDDESDEEVDEEEDFEIGEEEDAGPTKMHVLPLYSLLPTREQLRVFEPPPEGSRLVVLATNVAETSLTIPGIRYVFDCGRSKERKYDQLTGVQSFEVGWISKASASQRAGRAGRTGPGHCYKLYSSAVYERDFEDFAEPEILRMPIEGVVLQLKAMNLQHVINFPFPTPPDRQSLANSEKLLTYLSAISPTGQITSIGGTMSIFPLSPRFARILLIGHLHDCLPYTIALVAGLSAADIFIPENQAIPTIAPRDEESHFTQADRLEEDFRDSIQRKYNKVQKDFCFLDDKADAIKLLQVVGEFAHDPTETWCTHHFVRYKVLKEILQLRRQITDLLRTNIPAFSALKYVEKLAPPSAKQVKALKQMVASGFIDHVAIRADRHPSPPEMQRKPKRAIDVPYMTLLPSTSSREDNANTSAVFIHPSSPMAHISPQECPEFIIYSYLQKPPQPQEDDQGNIRIPKTRMHALTDIAGSTLAGLAKGTPLLTWGKPLKEVAPKESHGGLQREVWCVPYLRAETGHGVGWPLPARKVTQKKIAGRGWVVE